MVASRGPCSSYPLNLVFHSLFLLQLCFGETGTLEHRFHCPCTLPQKGWPSPPAIASEVLAGFPTAGRRFSKPKVSCLVLRLPAPPIVSEGEFEWICEPQECAALETCAWVLRAAAPSAFDGESCV